MSKTTMTAAFAALLALSTPAFADIVAANHVMPGQIRATEMNGATVYDANNQNLGDVKDILLDRDGKIDAVILNVGATLGVGGKFVAVPMSDIKVTFDKDNDKPRFMIGLTKDQLKAAQAFELDRKTTATGSSTAPRAPEKR